MPDALPLVKVTKVYPSLLQSGEIVFSEQESKTCSQVFGSPMSAYVDDEDFRAPRMTRTPRGAKTTEDIVSCWMNSYSKNIDLTKPEHSIAWSCELVGSTIQHIVSAIKEDGTSKTAEEAKIEFLTTLDMFDDKPASKSASKHA